MAGFSRAHLLIVWVLDLSARVTGTSFGHALDPVKNRLDAPKTAAGENRGLQFLRLFTRYLRRGRREVGDIDIRFRGRRRGNAAAYGGDSDEDDTELGHERHCISSYLI